MEIVNKGETMIGEFGSFVIVVFAMANLLAGLIVVWAFFEMLTR